MEKKTNIEKVDLQVNADKKVISGGKANTRILEICVTSPVNADQRERSPLNLSLVLDRSGSMAGEKLHFVKQAAAHVVDLLEEKDRISVTIYDDVVETIFASNLMTADNKTKAKTEIQKANSRSSTFLSGGWLKGCEEAARGATGGSLNRTLLLTDGLANVGITNIDELSTHSRELFNRGIATSCFGVGTGYDEHLLEAMANSGGGNFHFLETLSAIPVVFEREFEELVNISLRDVKVDVRLPLGVKAEVSGGWTAEMADDVFTISLGNLYSGKTQSVFLKLNFDDKAAESEIPLQITVRGKNNLEVMLEDKKSFSFMKVTNDEEASINPDQHLMERFALVDMADKANEALKRERAGDRQGASTVLNNSIREHSMNMPAGMMTKYNHLSNEMMSGMSEGTRKYHHREAYENKRGRDIVRDYMVNMVKGHLIASIEGRSVLIDTGVPISIGNEREWYFLHEVRSLSQDFMGVTIDYLNTMVGAGIDVLMGMDIMKNYHITVDLKAHRINFSTRTLFNSNDTIPMTQFMGVPSAFFTIAGNDYQMFVDSGAKLSYVDQKVASKFTPVGRENDFYPSLGEFETDVYEIPFQLGHSDFTLRCGVLPTLLETTMLLTGNAGIIGSEFFEHFVVDLAFPENAIYLLKY